MRLRLLAIGAAVMGGYLAVAAAPASATPVGSGPAAAFASSGPAESYMQYRRYRRHYAPRRVYYAPRRVYRRAYYRPYRYYRPAYGYPYYGSPYYGYGPGVGVQFRLF
jgi:hypothetical protein